MFQSSWLSVFGLALEMIGLTLLFVDLFRTKGTGVTTAEFRKEQDDLETSNRQLLLNMNKHVDLLSDFFGKLLVVIAREDEFENMRKSNPGLATSDPEKWKLINHALDKGPTGLRQEAAETFLRASQALPTSQAIETAIVLNSQAASRIATKFVENHRVAESLKRVATVGVALIAVGAFAQLFDLFL